VPQPILRYVITEHAADKMDRRGISVALVESVLRAPEQRFQQRPGRDVLQARARFGQRLYLIRVFVDVDRYPAEVVSVYRTSKLPTYWRTGP
jgi:hypothetical protein